MHKYNAARDDSEMHFCAAVDEVPEMRSILVLFEGVGTGACLGYGLMAEKPASCLLHLAGECAPDRDDVLL